MSAFKHTVHSLFWQFPYSTSTMCVPVKLLHSTVSALLELRAALVHMAHVVSLTHGQASGVAMSVALYYLLLLVASSAFMQHILRLPFAKDSFASHFLRTCGHLVLCLLVCSSSWLSISKFHAAMVVNNTWREDSCSSENIGSLGVEFVLHVASVLMYCCMSTSKWLPELAAEVPSHDHDE